MISWPSFRSSSIFGSGPLSRSRSRPPPPDPPPLSRAACADAAVAAAALAVCRAVAAASDVVIVGLEAVELLEGRYDVGDVEEAVALETEVNERRLHAGQHFRHPALVEIADDAALMLAFDEDLGNLIVLEDRDPCFVGARGDDHLLGHARSSKRTVARAPDGCSAVAHQQVRRAASTSSDRYINTPF